MMARAGSSVSTKFVSGAGSCLPFEDFDSTVDQTTTDFCDSSIEGVQQVFETIRRKKTSYKSKLRLPANIVRNPETEWNVLVAASKSYQRSQATKGKTKA